MERGRVVVAMSGGVDSCVAAAVLKEQGYDVIGITMQLWNHAGGGDERFDSCCSLTDVHDARIAADQIGVPHYLVNYEREFKAGVVDYFANEYAAGRTPNPCVMCNSKLKFDHLMDRAAALGAKWVATGHYARVEHFTDGRPSRLYRGVDARKDQSYFLFSLKREILDRILFPLADLNKTQVREIAARYQLHTSTKHESQEICFVTGKRYTDFLEEHYPGVAKGRGEIVDRGGKVLGYHDGIHKYTVGQRKGLSLGTPEPKFVAAIDAAANRVIVDDLSGLASIAFELSGANWLVSENDLLAEPAVEAVVRYHAQPVAATLARTPTGAWQVILSQPVRWVTPGQAAVIYRGEQVLGGGFITAPTRPTAMQQQRREHGHEHEVSASL